MRNLIIALLLPAALSAQVVGTTKTEEYRASFEQRPTSMP